MARGGYKKTKHDLLARGEVKFLGGREGLKDRDWFSRLRWRTVAPNTRKQYDGKVKFLKHKYGGYAFGHLVRYLRVENRHVVATKRGMISAVSDTRWCNHDPMPRTELEQLTFTLDVMEIEEADRVERASLTPEMYKQFLYELHRSGIPIDTQEGAEVMHDLASRTFNIRDMTRDRINLTLRTVQCERKATQLNKKRNGRYDVKPILTSRVHFILARRLRLMQEQHLPGNAAVFQNWQPELIGKLLRKCATNYDWPTGVHYCCYCLRHTAAAAAYADAHEIAKKAVRDRLAHKGAGNEMRYGASIALKKERRGTRG